MPGNEPPIKIDYTEDGDAWNAVITDARGKAVISFRYTYKNTPQPKTGGVTAGVYKRADEDYKGKHVVTPKSPTQLEKEKLDEWERNTLIEQATRPYEAP